MPKINIDLVTNWNDLTVKQLEHIAIDLHVAEKLYPDNEEEKNRMLYVSFWKTLLRENTMRATAVALREIPIADITPYIKFLFTGIKRTTFLPSIKVGFFKSVAPGPRLNNITIAEFSLADAAFYMWRKNKDEAYLNLLCAILYRPKKWFGNKQTDARQEFNKFTAEKRADRFKRLPLKTKLAISLMYEGCRNHLIDTRPYLFPKSDGNTNHTYEGFQKIILAKSGGKFGNYTETNNALAVDFLNELEEELKTAKK